MKTSEFCTKNGSCIPRQHFHENHIHCPFCAALQTSAAGFGLYVSVTQAGGSAKGLCALFCFGALWLLAFPPGLAQGSPSRNHLTTLALCLSATSFPPWSRTTAQQQTVTSEPPPETQEKRTMQKNTDFICTGFVSIVRGGRGEWHQADMTRLIKQSNYLFN